MSEKFIYGGKAGLAPGTLIYEGDTDPVSTSVGYVRITADSVKKTDAADGEIPKITADSVLWARFSGLADIKRISSAGGSFGLDPLIMEDILETSHRPKYQGLPGRLFIIMKQISDDAEISSDVVSQLSIVIGANYMLTFEEKNTKELDILEKRVLAHGNVFFARGSGYLAYALIDILVDSYLSYLDGIETLIEDMEDMMIASDCPVDADGLFELRRRLNILHRNTRPVYEIVEKLMKPDAGEILIIKKDAMEYLRDLADHAVRLSDSIQASRDAINAIYDENMSRIQLRTNKIINILTGFSVLLLPPMVIAGIFGMNFPDMPGLSSKFGFAAALGAMTAISAGMFYFFKRKKFF